VIGNVKDQLIALDLVVNLYVKHQIVRLNKSKDVVIVINPHSLDLKLKYLNKMNKILIVVQIKLFRVNE
jgi:hypothetical protein